ncbi:MAG: hypothetical protein AAF556_04085, partial [Pseudomonadota bacterium]
MNPLLSGNLTNALADQVIDAAKAAGLAVPPGIEKLHSGGDNDQPNRWHVAQGLSAVNGSLGLDGPGARQQAFNDLNRLTKWAQGLRDKPSTQALLKVQYRQQARLKAQDDRKTQAKVERAMTIDDALQIPQLAKVFEDPITARKLIRADLKRDDDPLAVAAQLKRTPHSYGDLVGRRALGVDLADRRQAKDILRKHIIAQLRKAGNPDMLSAPKKAMALPRPSAGPRVNQHLIGFDNAVSRLAETHAMLMASDVT